MAAKDAKKAITKGKKAAAEAVPPRRGAAGGAVWRVLSIGSTIVATKLATDAAQKGWKLATGRPVPIKGDFERERTRDVILFTAFSSMLVTAARVAAERGAATYFRNSSGHLPKRLEDQQFTPTDRKARLKLDRARRRSEFMLRRAIDRAAP
jgi:Protein of unknown function (DUF4235)